MELITSPDAMMAWSDAHRASGVRIGLVPTMGFLHRGHASLLDLLRPHCDKLVVSIFVNPMQFGAGEDLDRYPRSPEADEALCDAHGADAVFMPDTMYPVDFSTRVNVSGLTQGLCGGSRPTHFEGVTTVVARLFGLTRCDVAAFGEKDFQQLAVIRRMVRDLAMPVEVVGGPIVRDADGLALSSRNAYLSSVQRAQGLTLSRGLYAIAEGLGSGIRDVAALRQIGVDAMNVDALDYLEIVDAEGLTPLTQVDRSARALVAAKVGSTRLIDNLALVP